jgi:hypothetical protein
VLVACLAITPIILVGCSKADPLTDALDATFAAELRKVAASGVGGDVVVLTETAEAFIPIGTPLDAATKVLRSSGFRVVQARETVVPDGMDARYVGMKRSSLRDGIFDYYLYEIVLEVKDETVAEIFAVATYNAL